MLIVCKTCCSLIPHSARDSRRKRLPVALCRLRRSLDGDDRARSTTTTRRLSKGGALQPERWKTPSEAFVALCRAPPRRQAPNGDDRIGRHENRYALGRTAKTFAALLILGCAMGAVAAREPIVKAVPGDGAHLSRRSACRSICAAWRLTMCARISSISGDRKVLIVEGAIVNLRDSSSGDAQYAHRAARPEQAGALRLDGARAESPAWPQRRGGVSHAAGGAA